MSEIRLSNCKIVSIKLKINSKLQWFRLFLLWDEVISSFVIDIWIPTFLVNHVRMKTVSLLHYLANGADSKFFVRWSRYLTNGCGFNSQRKNRSGSIVAVSTLFARITFRATLKNSFPLNCAVVSCGFRKGSGYNWQLNC